MISMQRFIKNVVCTVSLLLNTETGETHLCGIPLDRLPGLVQYAWTQDGYLCMIATGMNQENTMKFLRILCRDMIPEPVKEETSPAPQE